MLLNINVKVVHLICIFVVIFRKLKIAVLNMAALFL